MPSSIVSANHHSTRSVWVTFVAAVFLCLFPIEEASAQLEPTVSRSALAPELSFFEPLIGVWEASGSGFNTVLQYRAGATGRVVYATNVLRGEDGEILTRYEGLYYWSSDANAIEYRAFSDAGEVHVGHVQTGEAVWHVAVVSGGATDGYRSVLQPTGAGTMEYRAIYRKDATSADVLASEALVYKKIDRSSAVKPPSDDPPYMLLPRG